MEYIRKAVERARASGEPTRLREDPVPTLAGQHQLVPRQRVVELDRAHLESRRIIAHDISDGRSGAFDMLRTQLLQAMDGEGWHLLAVTSPTAACGKTLLASNLALSIARLPERPVLLVDLDLRRPQIAASLGLKHESGLLSTLQGRTPLREAIIPAGIERYRIDVLIAERSVPNASAFMASRAMKGLLEQIRRDFRSHVVILDTSPMLVADDFLTLLPQLDCVLLVGAVGTSTISDIEHCKRHLQSANVVRVVLNKAQETNRPYYGY